MDDNQFSYISTLINQSRTKALRAVNTELIDLYWHIGAYISQKVASTEWGKGVVHELADYLLRNEPGVKGFSDKNLWRMKQFYEAYKDFPKLSPLVRVISWSHNLAVFSRCKTTGEREFYLTLCKQEHYSFRELDRQISAGLFERTVIGNKKLSTALRVSHPDVAHTFRDSYIFDFLHLPEPHNEGELQQALIGQMKNFILELGKDFLFIKADKFKPEHLGQLNFYLEALDRDVKKTNENPSIGILLCKDKDNEVVEYALSRSLSPTMISEYKTKLPDKKLLQQRLHEIFKNENG